MQVAHASCPCKLPMQAARMLPMHAAHASPPKQRKQLNVQLRASADHRAEMADLQPSHSTSWQAQVCAGSAGRRGAHLIFSRARLKQVYSVGWISSSLAAVYSTAAATASPAPPPGGPCQSRVRTPTSRPSTKSAPLRRSTHAQCSTHTLRLYTSAATSLRRTGFIADACDTAQQQPAAGRFLQCLADSLLMRGAVGRARRPGPGPETGRACEGHR